MHIVNNSRWRILLRKAASILCGIVGVWIISCAVGAHVSGMRTGNIEYRQYIAVIVVLSAVLLVVGGLLLAAAWKLWRVTTRSLDDHHS